MRGLDWAQAGYISVISLKLSKIEQILQKTMKRDEKEITTQSYYMLQRCMRCNS